MITALVDPTLLAPPANGSALAWLQALRQWSRTLREFDQNMIATVMSRDTQAKLASLIGGVAGLRAALEHSGSPLGAPEVLKLIEGIRARARVSEEVFEPSEVAFSSLELRPDYVDSGDDEVCTLFANDIGHAAACAQETNKRVAAITSGDAWRPPAGTVAVKARVDIWERDGAMEAPDEAGAISEAVTLWRSPRSVDDTLREDWAALLDHPLVGIEVAYRDFTAPEEESARPLSISVGDQFVTSMKAMGYVGKGGRVKAAFHAAAYVGSRRAGELRSLAPHPYRKTSGPTGQAVERSDGAKLMRGSLGRGRNAHRLMWWEAAEPIMLGVVEHDANPLALI